MPFKANADLPESVQTALTAEAQTIFRKAYNSIAARDPQASEESRMRQAWGAVKNAGWKAPEGGSGKWVKAASDEFERLSPEDERRLLGDVTRSEIEVHEAIALDEGAGVRLTKEHGYLVARPRVARSGVQLYRGRELGRPGLDEVRVYRPPEEVFAADSLRSYAHRPMTNNHPPELVTSDNWKEHAVGETGDEVLRDGDFVRVPTVLMDKTAIKDFAAGKKQLSLGYTMMLDWTPGVAPNGEAYDAVQTQIRANHLALVTAARGGPALRIGDANGESEMNDRTNIPVLKTIMVDQLPVQTDDTGAQIIQRHVATLTDKIAQLTAQVATLTTDGKAANDKVATLTATIATKDAEIAALKKNVEDAKLSPAQIDSLVKDRAEVVIKGRALIGDALVVDGKTAPEIRKQVVDSKLGAQAKDWNESQVTAAFATLTAGVKIDDQGAGGRDEVRDAFSHRPNGGDQRPAAYDAYDKGITEAWRMKPSTAAA